MKWNGLKLSRTIIDKGYQGTAEAMNAELDVILEELRHVCGALQSSGFRLRKQTLEVLENCSSEASEQFKQQQNR